MAAANQNEATGQRAQKTRAELKSSLRSAMQRVRLAGADGNPVAVVLKQEALMKEVLDAESLLEVMHIAGSIPHEWLADVDELPGNVFRVWAFGVLSFRKPGKYHGLRDVAVILIFLVQMLGGPLVVNTALHGWGQVGGSWYDWSMFTPSLEEWSVNWNANFLSLFLGFGYWMNAFISMEDAWQEWLRVFKFYSFLAKGTGGFPFALYLGAFTKCWCVFWCCNATWFLMGQCATPKDALYDLLGMLFVISLDSLGGDLTLVSESSWPAQGLGWIEENLDDMGAKVNPDYESRKGQVSIPLLMKPGFFLVKYYCFAGVFIGPILHIMTPWQALATEG